MNHKLLNTVFIILVSLTCLLIFILPYGVAFNPGAENDAAAQTWQNSYLIDDELSIILYAPFVLFWIIYLVLKKSLFKKIIQIILTGLSFFYFITAIVGSGFAMQDFEPGIGLLLTILLFPFMICMAINNIQRYKRDKK